MLINCLHYLLTMLLILIGNKAYSQIPNKGGKKLHKLKKLTQPQTQPQKRLLCKLQVHRYPTLAYGRLLIPMLQGNRKTWRLYLCQM